MDIPLWKNLTQPARLPVNRRFAFLKPDDLATLPVDELALLAQWMLAHDKIETKIAVERAGGIDLELENPVLKQAEYARVFGDRVTSNALYDVFEHVRGKPVKKLRVFILGFFPEADRKTQADYRLFLDLVDGQTWKARLKEIQEKDTRFFAERHKAKRGAAARSK